MRNEKLDSLVENACQQGCREVSNIINKLENSQAPKQMQALSSAERDYVHAELKSIMAVYNGGFCSSR